ncbi:MAG: Ig-like domain-containing protein [Rhizobium sp.]|nr:Ig-like domain-containing protein [Rhizobium sp.]
MKTGTAALEAQALSVGGTALTYTVDGNVLTAKAGNVTVFTLSIAANGEGTFTLNKPLDGNAAKAIDFSSIIQAVDADGDGVSLTAEKFVITVTPPDTTPPTVVSISMADTALKIGDTSTVTITFSEKVVGFDNDDVTVQEGLLGPLSSADGGITWTAVFTPTTNIEDTTNVVTVGSGFTDVAGNDGTGRVGGHYTVDTKAPVVSSITMSDAALKIGDTSTVTITFSEKVVGFDNDDVTVEKGLLGPLSSADGGITWTAVFTPTTNIEDTTNVVTVGSGYTDVAGNDGTGRVGDNYTVDTKAPVVSSITMSDAALKIGDTSTVTITFSEKVVGFADDDVTVEKGLLGPLSGADGGITWTAVFTPTTNIEDTTNVVTVGSGYTDVAGNDGTGRAGDNYTVDTKAPTVAITLADDNLTVGQTSLVTFTFSERVEGFSNADLEFENGTLTNVATSNGGLTWTATFTPTAGVNDATNVIRLKAGSVFDLAGNANADASVSGNIVIDTRPTNLAPTDIRFTGNVNLTESRDGKDTEIASGSQIFKMTAIDPDDTSGFDYKFGASQTQSVNVGGSETFTVNGSSGQVTTSSLDFDGVQSVTISTPTVADADGAVRTETVTVRFGEYDGDTIDGASTTHDQVIYGFGGNDTISGGNGDDWISGGDGADTLTGGAGRDTFAFAASDSQGDVESSEYRVGGNRINLIDDADGYDVITDFVVGVDKLELPVAAIAANNANSTNGTDSALGYDLTSFRSHSISNGIIRFDDTNSFDNPDRLINTSAEVGMALDYLLKNNFGAGVTVAFTAVLGSGSNSVSYTFVYQQGGSSAGSNHTFVALQGTTISDFNALITSAAIDPIILDLDKNGFAFSSIDNGVTFDINADGKADQIAWTSDDGILAYDVDGNGLIDNGSEIFTPDFNGGKFASGVAALASLDTNGDGKIDSGDAAFKDLKIWVDADNNGISDEGELSSLFDNGVTSISLTTDNTGGQEDGQTVFSTGTFTFADGSTGDFMEVGFDTIFGSDADPLTVMGTDGDDILHGGMGQVVMTGGAGNDTFVFDGTALDELDVADVITDFNGDGDVLDVTALLDSLLGEQASAETAASHLRATVDDGNTTVSVQTGADTWKDVVVLQNHDTAIKVLFDDKHAVVTPHD